MCKGLSSLPSSCLEKAKEMRVKIGQLADTHKHRVQDRNVLQNLDSLLTSKNGLPVFRAFLQSEFSEENLEFWLACEDFRLSSTKQQQTKASSIYNQFIYTNAPQEVNLDAETREAVLGVMDSPCADMFTGAQQRIFALMAKDSFPRFLRSSYCEEAVKAF